VRVVVQGEERVRRWRLGGRVASTIAPDKVRTPHWYWLLAPALMVVLSLYLAGRGTGTLAYSDFKRLLHAGKVTELTISDAAINGMVKPGGVDKVLSPDAVAALRCPQAGDCPFGTVRVEDPQLTAELEAAGVRYAGQAKDDWVATVISWALPVALFLWLWSSVSRKAGTSSGWLFDVGKSRARVYVASESGVRFDDVAGIDEAKEELEEVVAFLRSPERYRRLGGRIPKGVLIVGAPGTGKTLLARAVAGEAGVPFFSISGSEFVEMFVGVGAARVRDLFAQAQQKAPCIIFIDELDALGKARGVAGLVGGNNEQEQTLNQLLVEMDGFDTARGVIILAATNRPETLDPALLRPGRFDRHIALDLPDLRGRERILAVHAAKVTLSGDVDLAVLAARTAGFAGADLANLVNEAALLAGRAGKDAVEMNDFDEAIDRVVAGLQKKTRIITAAEKETVAYHEAGHALVAESRPYADRVAKISIIPRGIAALGYTQQLPAGDRYLLKKAELLDRIDVFLGGRVAEELATGDISTGAQNDLQLATDMARQMVTQYGMSRGLGLATFQQPAAPLLNPALPQQRMPYSERTARIIDSEIEALLGEAHARVVATLKERRAQLDALAHALLERETVDRAGLDTVLAASAQAPPRQAPPPVRPVPQLDGIRDPS
jgi:cell division protease FtsH